MGCDITAGMPSATALHCQLSCKHSMLQASKSKLDRDYEQAALWLKWLSSPVLMAHQSCGCCATYLAVTAFVAVPGVHGKPHQPCKPSVPGLCAEWGGLPLQQHVCQVGRHLATRCVDTMCNHHTICYTCAWNAMPQAGQHRAKPARSTGVCVIIFATDRSAIAWPV